jgi:hypothetical protein
MESITPAAAVDATAAEQNPTFEWCTVDEVARVARVSSRHVRRDVRLGLLRAAIVDRRGTLRIHRNWIRIWLEGLADERAFAKPSDASRSRVCDFKRTAAADRNGDCSE